MTLEGLTRLGLGMAALGRPGYITLGHGTDLVERTRGAMEAQAHAVLDAAFAHGVRYVDCARVYGDAENFVRSWLDRRGARGVVVGSKWGYSYEAAWRVEAERHERKDHSLGMLERQLAESQAILGEHLAVYQIHSATPETGVLEDAAVLDALARLRASGVAIGLSTSGPSQAETIRRALEIERDSVPLFRSVQATWNLLERSCEDALREAHEAGRVVLVKEALANGRLTARGGFALLDAVAREQGVSPDAIALAAALARPWAHVVLLGATTVAQLESNLRAVGLAVDEGRLEALRTPGDEYWRARAKLPWN